MFTLEQGSKLVKLARRSIKAFFDKKEIKLKKEEGKEFKEKQGVFVTLHTYPEKQLRGCIGLPYPVLPLSKAVVEAAKSAAFNDPRFFPLAKSELDKIIIEISVLTVPELIKCKPVELLKKVRIGKDGLICSYGNYSGLLLPQVATEQKWNAKEFLEQTCVKAGLSPTTWLKPECRFYRFQAQIFCEEKPNGKVVEKR